MQMDIKMDNTTTDNICISSYNSTGFGLSQQAYIETLSLFSDIVCIQEHFLLDAGDKKHSNTDKIRKKFSNNFDMYIVPAFKSNNNVKRGRGSGGLATMWRKSLTKYVSRLSVDNYRIQATIFKFPSGKLLLLHTYFMCDPQCNNFNDGQLLALLDDIHGVIQLSECSNIMWTGDVNSDFSRNSRFVQIIRSFIDNLNLKIFWTNPNEKIENVDFTHSSTIGQASSFSTIDHFISTERIYNLVLEAGVIHSGENVSNHSAIYCKVDIGRIDLSMESVKLKPKPSWEKADEEHKVEFSNYLVDKLGDIEIPDCIGCTNSACNVHDDDIEWYSSEVLGAVNAAAHASLPLSGGGGAGGGDSQRIPGWNEHVKPFKSESVFWHSVWVSSGCPNRGDLYHVMKSSKLQYKYAVRRLKRASERLQNDQFVQELLKGDSNIFSELKKYRGISKTCSSTIDEEVGASNISNHFANIYSKLYSKVQHDEAFNLLVDDIEHSVGAEGVNEVDRVTEDLVKLAIKKMKAGKSDGIYDFTSDCIINAPPDLIKHLTNLIRTFIIHGKVPYFLLICTLVPIVKDNLGDSASSDNYRAIAIGSLLLKLLDWVILLLEGDKLSLDQLQYGYQALTSTTMCTWTVNAVVEHYNMRGRVVYGTAMDCSKAFDMVHWTELFLELRKKGVSPSNIPEAASVHLQAPVL